MTTPLLTTGGVRLMQTLKFNLLANSYDCSYDCFAQEMITNVVKQLLDK